MDEYVKAGSKMLLALGLISLAVPVWGANMAPLGKPLPVSQVTSVTATAPLASSGGATPNITLSGIVPIANGGTGTTTGLAGMQQKIGRVAIVAQSGGDYTDPLTAMNDLDTWCGSPSLTNPCLLKIMPGFYDLGGGSLAMKSFVDIEGSGEDVTTINSTYGAPVSGSPVVGVVNGADNAEIRFLTVKNTTSEAVGVAIANISKSPKITHVTAIGTGGPLFSTGIYNASSSPTMTNVTVIMTAGAGDTGVYNDSSSPMMQNVNVTASGGGTSVAGVWNANSSSPTMVNVTATVSGSEETYGIRNESSSPTMINVITTATAAHGAYAVYNDSSSVIMKNVIATATPPVGSGWPIFGMYTVGTGTVVVDNSTISAISTMYTRGTSVACASSSVVNIGGSKLVGGAASNSGGTLTCAASYDGNYAALGANCQ